MEIIRGTNQYQVTGAGAIPRLVSDKALEIVSVMDLGALGDGSNDDTAAIQEALDNHGFVIFPRPSSFYKITDSLRPPTGCTIFGLGSKIRLTATSSTGGAIFIGGVTDVHIDGLEVECQSGLLSENGIGIAREFAGSTISERILVTGCYIHGFKNSLTPNFFGGTGLVVEVGAVDVRLFGNTVDDCDNGCWLAGNAAYLLRNVSVVGNTFRNITNTAADLTVTGNGIYLSDNPTLGDPLAPSTFDGTWTIQGNTVDGAPVFCHVLNASRYVISGNTGRNITTYGYFLQEGWYGKFSDNVVGGAMTSYVRIQNNTAAFGGLHHSITNNDFLGSASGDGIVNVGSSGSRCLVAFNKMQAVTGTRISGFGISSVVIDQDDAALTGVTEFQTGLSVANNVAIQARASGGTLGNIVKVDGSNHTQLYRIGDTTTPVGRIDATGMLVWAQALALTGSLLPSALTGDVNDYSPAGLSTANYLRIDPGAANRNITGLATGVAGRLLMLSNGGANNLVLVYNSGSSTAANRFFCPGLADVTVRPGGAVWLYYDGASAVWRVVAP